MAEPFVFYFSPDSSGRPEVMYIADARVECGLCKHPQLQRFYHSTPFHTLTAAKLETLLREVPSKAGYECENCGEHVGPEDVVTSTLTYGFPDTSGVVIGFFDGQTTGWKFEANRRLDPQRLPVFRSEHLEELTDDTLEEHLGRLSSAKAALVELLQDDDDGWLRVSADMIWVVSHEDSLEDMLDELEETFDFQDPVFVTVNDCVPDEIGTHVDYSKLTGRWTQWLGEPQRSKLCNHVVGALVDGLHAQEVFERVLEVARLSAEVLDDEWRIWSQVTTPGGIVFPRQISLQSILRRAVYTGITPGESARLTGEELAGLLLRVWKMESK